MNVLGLLIVATVGVAPGKEVVNHNQPYHSGQPIIHRFERGAEDEARHRSWDAYNRELDDLWQDYREGGSTARGWQKYKDAVAEAKRAYVTRDKYLAPITP